MGGCRSLSGDKMVVVGTRVTEDLTAVSAAGSPALRPWWLLEGQVVKSHGAGRVRTCGTETGAAGEVQRPGRVRGCPRGSWQGDMGTFYNFGNFL